MQIIPIKILWNCAPFTSYISRINHTQIDDAQYIGVVIPMYNLIEYSDSYSKTSGISLQYCRDISVLDNDGEVMDFNEANVTGSFNLKKNK